MRWHNQLDAKNCITDVRGDVLRIGLGLYHDEDDIGRLADLLEALT
jgi:selenocysteine lyase/cysteine desulfurase